MIDPAKNLQEIVQQCAEAAVKANRDPASVTVIGVSKVHGPERIVPVLEAGHRVFGENRVQEAQGKWPALQAQFPETELHLVGPLQTNKVPEALALFNVLHSLDRPKLAQKIRTEIDKGARAPALFVQVNTGEEEQKSGVLPGEADAFIRHCRDDLGLNVIGLMGLPPVDEEPALHFSLLAKIAERNKLEKLSMGMTADFETAIALGATHIRIGTALFGERPKRP